MRYKMKAASPTRMASRRCFVIALMTGSLVAPNIVLAKPSRVVIVALGASQTYGKGVSRTEVFPAQLEAMLHAAGHNVQVVNAGINGDTTSGMLGRMSAAIPKGTKIVILQPGANDKRMGLMVDREGNMAEIESRLSAQGIRVIMLENANFRGMPRGPDGQHLTPEGYHMIAEQVMSEVEPALTR